jgi:flagellin-like hook-associated protein FlgL
VPEKQRLLELALKGLEAERAKIDDEIAQIRSQLNHGRATATVAGVSILPKRKTMTAAAQKKISGNEA